MITYTNKRLGVYLQLPLQDPAFIRGPALNRENTVYTEAKATLGYISEQGPEQIKIRQ